MICGPLGRALAQLVYETTDSEANRILISLGAVEERPLPLRLIFALLLVAATLAIWVALAWNT
jgi:hypothetical protein